MKLLQLPTLIQNEIFTQLSFNNLLFLSLCSKTVKNLIFSIRSELFKSVQRIQYDLDSIRVRASAITHSKRGFFVISAMESTENHLEKVEIDGMSFHRSGENLNVLFDSGKWEPVIQQLHSLLQDFFGVHTKLWTQKNTWTPYLARLRGIQQTEIMANSRFSAKELDDYLSGTPDLEIFNFTGKIKLNQRIREDSKLYGIDTIEILSDGYLASDVLKFFNGRQAFLSNRYVTEFEINTFLDKWKSGERYGHLELLICQGHPNLSLDEDRLKRIHREVTFPINKKHHHHSYHWKDSEFKSRFYIVRESDNHVASVAMESGKFMIGAWEMTESEFLDKFGKEK